ncbi:hypothetical protein HDV00_003613 [Rhizophlyctis rosea]|nr:hypothetical protein HDV00_003613 [Rhizophlyctis rosea]
MTTLDCAFVNINFYPSTPNCTQPLPPLPSWTDPTASFMIWPKTTEGGGATATLYNNQTSTNITYTVRPLTNADLRVCIEHECQFEGFRGTLLNFTTPIWSEPLATDWPAGVKTYVLTPECQDLGAGRGSVRIRTAAMMDERCPKANVKISSGTTRVSGLLSGIMLILVATILSGSS